MELDEERSMIEILIGLNVTNQDLYTEYRSHMSPLLKAHGGRFTVDVHVAEVLCAPEPQPINRLFTIRFPSLAQHDAFFAHPDYLAVRKRYFEPSVGAVQRLARYEVLNA
jgi:uncharacterized protein (DUF1330 family)